MLHNLRDLTCDSTLATLMKQENSSHHLYCQIVWSPLILPTSRLPTVLLYCLVTPYITFLKIANCFAGLSGLPGLLDPPKCLARCLSTARDAPGSIPNCSNLEMHKLATVDHLAPLFTSNVQIIQPGPPLLTLDIQIFKVIPFHFQSTIWSKNNLILLF